MRWIGASFRLSLVALLLSLPAASLFAQNGERAREILLDKLDLTPGQAKLLVSLIGEAAEFRKEFGEYEAAKLPVMEVAYQELLSVVELDQEISDEVAGKAGGEEHRWLEARKTLAERLNVLEEKLATALTERQLRLVSTYDPSCPDDWAEKVADRDRLMESLGADLVKLPRLSATDYARTRDRLVKEIRKACCLEGGTGKKDLPEEVEQDIEWALVAHLNRIRRSAAPVDRTEEQRLVEAALEVAREAYIASAPLADARRRELAEEMESIHRHRYGETGAMAEHLLDPALLPLLDGSREAAAAEDPALAGRRERIQELGDWINSYNLMNGLHLSRSQVKGLLQLNAYRTRANKGAVDKKIDETLSSLLRDSQEEVVRDYQPCLIPPANLRDPVRVGQAHDSTEASKFLDSIREISEAEYRQAANKIVEGAILQAERANGRMEPAVREDVATRIRQALDRARALDDLDYVFQRSEIVEELEAANRKDVVKDEIERLSEESGKEYGGPSKAATFLLKDSVTPLLQRRLALMNEKKVPSRLDLDSIEGAESCKDGCALK